MINKIEKDNDAIFSGCRKYRYALWRLWDSQLFYEGNKSYIMFVGLNPSTANESIDDPTIRRVIRFSKEWGYGGVFMLNLFAFVSAYPEELKKCEDPIGNNDEWLKEISSMCKQVVFAWGNFKEAEQRANQVIKMFPDAICLGKNKNGSPKHPLYISANTKPIKY